MIPPRRRLAAWCVGTAAVSVPFLAFACAPLATFRPFSNDEAWIMSGSYKLATEGVFGSNLFTGLFRGDELYFFNLPAFHYAQAAVFRFAGVGIAQARWPSVAAAAVLLWSCSWLAFRWYGARTAWLATLLLVAWPSNLSGVAPGLPLLGAARSGRYDLFAVAWMWVALACFVRWLARPGRLMGVVAGGAAGVATLTQFFGVCVVPAMAAAWLLGRRSRPHGAASIAWVVAGFVTVVAPYAIAVARHPVEWHGQMVVIRGEERMALGAVSFYVRNVLGEPRRFAHLAGTAPAGTDGPVPASAVALALAGWAAIGVLLWRVRVDPAHGDVVLGLYSASAAGALALVDATKAPLYALVLLPPLCLVTARVVVAMARWAQTRTPPLRRRAPVVALLAAAGVAAGSQSLRAFRADQREWALVGPYADPGQRLRSAMDDSGAVLGPNRWWLALDGHRYLSVYSVWWRWRLAWSSGQGEPRLDDLLRHARVRYLIVTSDVRSDLVRFPEPLQRQYWAFVGTSCRRVAAWRDAAYGDLELYEVVGEASRS